MMNSDEIEEAIRPGYAIAFVAVAIAIAGAFVAGALLRSLAH